MTTIKCVDPKLYPFKLKKFGRVKKIFFGKFGPFYRRYGHNVLLDWVDRLPYPFFYETEEGKQGTISGTEYIGCGKCLYVEILDDGETVQLWEEA